jgi:hypothetical protein
MTDHHRIHHILPAIFLLACLLLTGMAPGAVPPLSPGSMIILTVDTNQDSLINSGCLETDDDDDCSLRGAIALANADILGNDYHIDVPIGVYLLNYLSGNATEDLNASGDLDILNDAVVLHGESMLLTIIDGNGTDRVIDYLDEYGAFTISTLTIRNGSLDPGEGGGAGLRMMERSTLLTNYVRILGNHVSGPSDELNNGGGIYGRTAATMTLVHTAILENSACNGGGIRTWGNSLTLDHSTIEDNDATCDSSCGGGLSLFSTGTTTILDSTIDGNTAYRGAGLFGGTATLTIQDSTFSYNAAAFNGGGLDLYGDVSLTNVTLWNNSALSKGGGIIVEGAIDLINVTLAGNEADYGGGVYVNTGSGNTLAMDHVSFAANTAESIGSVIYVSSESIVTVTNTILASPSIIDNCYVHALADWTSNGYNISNDGSCPLSSTGDWVNTNPMLGTLGDFGGPTLTLPLLTSSPAIDFGNPADSASRWDQRGVPIMGGRSDIGAFEYIPPSLWLPLFMKP